MTCTSDLTVQNQEVKDKTGEGLTRNPACAISVLVKQLGV